MRKKIAHCFFELPEQFKLKVKSVLDYLGELWEIILNFIKMVLRSTLNFTKGCLFLIVSFIKKCSLLICNMIKGFFTFLYNHKVPLIWICVATVILVLFISPFPMQVIQDRVLFEVKELHPSESEMLQQLIEENKIYTASFVTRRLITFYQNLISVVLGFLALGGIFCFFYIRKSHSRDITEGIKSEVESRHVRCILQEELKKILAEEKKDGDIGLQLERIDDLAERVVKMENLNELVAETCDVSTPPLDGKIEIPK